MNNKLFKATVLVSLTAFSFAANAQYTYYLSAESGSGGFLEKGSISFVTKTAVTPPTDGGGEVETPVEPETPEEEKPEEIDGKTFLYKVSLGQHSSTASSFLFPNQPLAGGSPLSCGDKNTGNCFVVSGGSAMVVMTYQGTDSAYATNFPIGDTIIVKSGAYNTTAECSLTGNNSYFTDTIVRNVQIAYKCPTGSLPVPSKVEALPASVNAQITVNFYKKK